MRFRVVIYQFALKGERKAFNNLSTALQVLLIFFILPSFNPLLSLLEGRLIMIEFSETGRYTFF